MHSSYQPLRGVKVLDIGLLIPAALTSIKLAAMGADVVKVEMPHIGDRLRHIPPFADDGESLMIARCSCNSRSRPTSSCRTSCLACGKSTASISAQCARRDRR